MSKAVNLLPFVRNHIIYCYAIPSEVSLKEFTQLIERFHNDIRFIRVIYDIKETNVPPPYYSVVLYFSGQIAADNFYQDFNCEIIGRNDEVLFLLFVSKVIFTSKSFEDLFLKSEIEIENSVELPKCPVCIEKLDGSITGLYFEMMKKVRNYDREDRWLGAQASCDVCKNIRHYSEAGNIAKCNACECDKNTWICLVCGNVGCGRYDAAHAHDHFQCSLHNFALELQTFRIWDYKKDTYVHRIVRSKESLVLNLPDCDQRENLNNQKLLNDRMEAMLWEYNYLLSTQLEEQRNYYEEKMNEMKAKFENSPTHKSNEEKIAFLQQENEDLKKKVEEYDKEYKSYAKKIKMTKDKNESLTKEVEELLEFNSSIEDNLKNFEKESKVSIDTKEDEEIKKERERLQLLQDKLTKLFMLLEE